MSDNAHYALTNDIGRARWIAACILPYEAELRSWLKHHVGLLTPADADDLIQEVFARILAADYSTIRNPRAYLYATMRHLLRENARRNRIVSIDLLGRVESLNLISEEPGPDRHVGARQELERVRAIVAQLPAQCRRVFILRKLQGLSHGEIAEQMGITQKTVINHLTRALMKISERLAAQEAFDKPLSSLTTQDWPRRNRPV